MMLAQSKQYRYSAFDITGEKISGSINASSAIDARQKLLSNSMIAKNVYRQVFPFFLLSNRRISRSQLAILLEILGLLIKSGCSITYAVSLLNTQTQSDVQQRVIHQWKVEILAGKSLASTLRDTDTPIPDKLMTEISINERAGQLGIALLDSSRQIKRHEKIKASIKYTLFYALVFSLIATLFY